VWGRNTSGQLGYTPDAGSQVPIQVGIETNWKQVRAVGNRTYALKTNGTLWGWGLNISSTPLQLGVASNWQSLGTGHLGGWFSAVRTDGTLWSAENGDGSMPIFNQVGTDTTWIVTACAQTSLFAIQAP
jgi:alpha-tubulin suppressor-like RCC1 family protein